jgi:putative ABC transport system permease protein
MFAITLYDLRFRSRQFVIALLGAGLVFSMTLLLAGLAAGFRVEVNQTVLGMGAKSWIVAAGATGRIAALPPMPYSLISQVQSAPGVGHTDPLVVVPQAAVTASGIHSMVLVGHRPGGLGAPAVVTGRPVARSGEAVVDQRLGFPLGQRFSVGGRSFTVVGTVTGRTLLGGTGDVYVTLDDAQSVVFGGRPLVNAFLTTGTPTAVPPGLQAMSNSEIETRSLAQMASGVSSIDSSRSFMWVIAAVIVAALVYVSALERTRDFAVLKALGSSTGSLFAGLATQAVLVALCAAALAAVIANFMTGLFAQPVDIPGSAYVVLPVSALAVGLIASLVALRRAISVDPAVAFSGA